MTRKYSEYNDVKRFDVFIDTKKVAMLHPKSLQNAVNLMSEYAEWEYDPEQKIKSVVLSYGKSLWILQYDVENYPLHVNVYQSEEK